MTAREHLIGVLLMAGIGATLLALGWTHAAGAFFGGALIELPFAGWTWLRSSSPRSHPG